MKNKRRFLIAISVLLIAMIVFALVTVQWMWKHTDNTGLVVTTYQIASPKIPQDFHGFRIAQVADLHNTQFGENNSELLSLLRESQPDIIVFTGDQVDTSRRDIQVVLSFVREAVKIAPCYLVTGNHEGNVPEIEQLNEDLRAAGVILMDHTALELQQGGSVVTLLGLGDPTMDDRFVTMGQQGSADDALSKLNWNNDTYSILLSHHPEFMKLYSKYGVDVALCGHAHGGQVRIGDVGIIAPHQGLFPKYDAGQYTLGNTTMILSRGLGNSRFPWRVNNPPELVVIELIGT